jgi:hypothetical protein
VSADVTPDLAGFRDAQERKRLALGEDVIFRWPAARVYAADVSLNADGEPLDPTVQPQSEVVPTVTVHAGVAQGVGTLQRLSRESTQSAAGRFERAEVMVIVNLADAAQLDGATSFERVATGETFEIVADREDGVSIPDRYLVYGREEST